jgi:hypothetical protein
MLNQPQYVWLAIEGIIPLFGASVVYLISGCFKKLASPGSTFAWKESVDSMGWLYGSLIIAVQAATRLITGGAENAALGFGCIVCAGICGLQLLSAMNERGANSNWQPPLGFKLAAFVMTLLILTAGFEARVIVKDNALQSGAGQTTSNGAKSDTKSSPPDGK